MALMLIVTGLLMLIGLVFTVLPGIPGPLLIFGGALLFALVEGFQIVGWPTLVALGIMAALATGAEAWAGVVGARAGGASGWGILGGLVGGLVGLVFFSLPGGIVGAVLGVLLVELIRNDDAIRALKAGGGWLLGWLLSVVIQLSLGVAMVALFWWQVWRGL
jgi:uncharacterized protein YqgC (DUF456 family)